MSPFVQRLLLIVLGIGCVVGASFLAHDQAVREILLTTGGLLVGKEAFARAGDVKMSAKLPKGLFNLPLLFTLAFAAIGCGGSQLEQHTTALTVSRAVLDASADVITAERYAALERAAEEGVTALEDAKAQWAPAVETHALAVYAWQTWREATLILIEAEKDGREVGPIDLAPLAARLLDLYDRLRATLIVHGVKLPQAPGLLRDLAGPLPDPVASGKLADPYPQASL